MSAVLAGIAEESIAGAGVEGRKVLLLVSGKLSYSPGFEVWEYLRAALRASGLRDDRPDVPLLGASEYDQRKSSRDLAAAANAANVSFYTFDAAGLAFEPHTSAESGGVDSMIDTSLSSVLDESILQLLADETGGLAAIRRNDAAGVLAEMEQDWRTYYALGYPTPPKRENRPRDITVRVRRPGLKVRTRHAVLERSADERLAEQVSAALFFPRQQNPLDARVEVSGLRKTPRGTLIASLFVRVPYARLSLIPDGRTLRGGFLFAAAVRAPDDRFTDVSRKRIPVEMPVPEGGGAVAGEFAWQTTFEVRPGRQLFSIALVDEISRTTTFLQPEVNVSHREGGR